MATPGLQNTVAAQLEPLAESGKITAERLRAILHDLDPSGKWDEISAEALAAAFSGDDGMIPIERFQHLGLAAQQRILHCLVPGDLLQRQGLTREGLTAAALRKLRGEVRYQAAPEPFPACTANTDAAVTEYERRAAELAGGTFNAEPGEGKTPPADPELQWERGYLLADQAHEVIPVIAAQLRAGGAKPVAILLHGTGSSKEKMIPHIAKYATQGFFAVAVDHRYLGERSVIKELSADLALIGADGAVNLGQGSASLATRLAVWARLSRPARLAAYQIAMKRSALGQTQEHPFVFDSAWDIIRLVDYLETRTDVKKEWGKPVIGLMGVSLGGMVTQLAAAADLRIRAAAPMISMQCFELQKDWRMWAPRCKTLQIPFKAVAERDGCKVADVNAQCRQAAHFRALRSKLEEELYEKLGISDQMARREEMITADDRFMREMGVDEAVVERVYAAMNPGLVGGTLDGPQVMRAVAPRPLLMANAAAGQRCPVETVLKLFHESKGSWTHLSKGRDMRLYIACQPVLHHSDREDLHHVINQFLRLHILGARDKGTDIFADCDDEGKRMQPVPGQTGWMFSGKDQVLSEESASGLTLQEQVLAKLVPGDVLQRSGLKREGLTAQRLKDLRGTPKYQQVADVFPAWTESTDALCMACEKSGAELAGGEFNAEPGEGAVPPADPELQWERGYLLGERPHEIIPLLMAKQKGGQVRPAAIMLHGTGSSKEKMIPHLAEYAKAGFFAIGMDHRYLGERSMTPELHPDIALYFDRGGDLNLGPGSKVLAQRLAVWPRLSRATRLASYQVAMKKSALGESAEHPFVFNSAWDVIRLVDYLGTRDDVEKISGAPHVCLWGISLGGMVTQLAAAADARIAAAAPMISVQCFELQRDWKMWAPRCKTLQVPFRAVANKAGSTAIDVDRSCEQAAAFRKLRLELNEEFFDRLGIKDQMAAREKLIDADDRFMRELGVDEQVVKLTYDKMNPHLLDGLLDGPEALQAIAPRPLLMCNAGAGQRCPIETVWEVFQSMREAWQGVGHNLLLYVACEPMVHHAVSDDFLVVILQFLRKHMLGASDEATRLLQEPSWLGTKLEPTPGHKGMLFRGDTATPGF